MEVFQLTDWQETQTECGNEEIDDILTELQFPAFNSYVRWRNYRLPIIANKRSTLRSKAKGAASFYQQLLIIK